MAQEREREMERKHERETVRRRASKREEQETAGRERERKRKKISPPELWGEQDRQREAFERQRAAHMDRVVEEALSDAKDKILSRDREMAWLAEQQQHHHQHEQQPHHHQHQQQSWRTPNGRGSDAVTSTATTAATDGGNGRRPEQHQTGKAHEAFRDRERERERLRDTTVNRRCSRRHGHHHGRDPDRHRIHSGDNAVRKIATGSSMGRIWKTWIH